MESARSGGNLTMTVLPSWLSRPEFRPLAAEVPGYVMQVHSLHLPDQPGQWAGLCDPVEILTAVDTAEALGIPFRLALPTYSCLVVFDDAGKVAEVVRRRFAGEFPCGCHEYSGHGLGRLPAR